MCLLLSSCFYLGPHAVCLNSPGFFKYQSVGKTMPNYRTKLADHSSNEVRVVCFSSTNFYPYFEMSLVTSSLIFTHKNMLFYIYVYQYRIRTEKIFYPRPRVSKEITRTNLEKLMSSMTTKYPKIDELPCHQNKCCQV